VGVGEQCEASAAEGEDWHICYDDDDDGDDDNDDTAVLG